MANSTSEISEAAVLRRVKWPSPALPPAAARAILQLTFSEADRLRMQELAEKAQRQPLLEPELRQAEVYGRVDSLLAVLKSNARRSLKRTGQPADKNRRNGK